MDLAYISQSAYEAWVYSAVPSMEDMAVMAFARKLNLPVIAASAGQSVFSLPNHLPAAIRFSALVLLPIPGSIQSPV